MKMSPDCAKQDRGVPALQRLAAVAMCANEGGIDGKMKHADMQAFCQDKGERLAFVRSF